jgi:hypothetical protein
MPAKAFAAARDFASLGKSGNDVVVPTPPLDIPLAGTAPFCEQSRDTREFELINAGQLAPCVLVICAAGRVTSVSARPAG